MKFSTLLIALGLLAGCATKPIEPQPIVAPQPAQAVEHGPWEHYQHVSQTVFSCKAYQLQDNAGNCFDVKPDGTVTDQFQSQE